jgi:integrase
MTENARAVGRPRRGQLVWRKSGWVARLTVVVDGERIRVCRPLGTDNKAVARRKLARLLESEGDTSPEEAARPETFEEAARRIVANQGAEGHRTWKDRLARLQRLAFPEFGQLPVNEVRPPHIRQALDLGLSKGLSRRTLALVKIDVSTVLGELWRDEVIAVNPAAQVVVPKGAPCDDRERVVLTDEEFGAFMACPDITPELHMMALASRTLGGMRTSDLHAWDWAHIDTVNWSGARVPRPKTKTKDRLALPPVLIPVLQAWWDAHGRPMAGPVFPVRKGPRAGERKRGKNSHALALREAVWMAGVVRPLPGFEAAWMDLEAARRTKDSEVIEAAELEAKRRCLIQSGSDEYKPLDFHSFRRAYNTALAGANVNVQIAMRLAGHRSASTHMRYVLFTDELSAPAQALPILIKAPPVPKLDLRRFDSPRNLPARPVGFEPTTLGFEVRCSIQLS